MSGFYSHKESWKSSDEDLFKLLVVVCIVLIYFTFHLRSFFLAFASGIQLLMSIPIALCIYRYVFGITYFERIHLSSLMLIIGVGSDDVFVFHDMWANARKIPALKN